jgi:hypothetical protein
MDLLASSEIGATMAAAIREAEQRAVEPLAILERELQGSDAALKLGRLQAQLAKARTDHAAAKDLQREALKRARLALGDGDNPAPHEEEAQQAQREQTVLQNRQRALEPLIVQAQRAVDSERQKAVSAKRRELRQQALAAYQRAEAALLTALHVHLPAILTAHASVAATAPTAEDMAEQVARDRDQAVSQQITSTNGTGPALAPQPPLAAKPALAPRPKLRDQADTIEERGAERLSALGVEGF